MCPWLLGADHAGFSSECELARSILLLNHPHGHLAMLRRSGRLTKNRTEQELYREINWRRLCLRYVSRTLASSFYCQTVWKWPIFVPTTLTQCRKLVVVADCCFGAVNNDIWYLVSTHKSPKHPSQRRLPRRRREKSSMNNSESTEEKTRFKRKRRK